MIYLSWDAQTGITYALYDGVLISLLPDLGGEGHDFLQSLHRHAIQLTPDERRLAHHYPVCRNWSWRTKVRCTFQRQHSLIRFGTIVHSRIAV